MTSATATTDHTVIRSWVEARGGQPARVKGQDDGILRIDFGEPEESLEPIDWETFFAIFEGNNLAFLHQDMTEDGGASRFNKFVER